MKARRDLLGELPILGQMTAASTNSDAYLPVHPGAAAFYNGTQQSFLDKWGNAIFLAPMIFGGLVSVAAAAWKFLRAGEPRNGEEALDLLYALGGRIRTTQAETNCPISSARSTRCFRPSAPGVRQERKMRSMRRP